MRRLGCGNATSNKELDLRRRLIPEEVHHILFFFSSRRRHTTLTCDWSSDVCSSDLSEEENTAASPIERVINRANQRFARYQDLRIATIPRLQGYGFRARQDIQVGEMDQKIGRASCRERVGR